MAPEISAPLLNHLYVGLVPDAVTVKVAKLGAQIATLVGCAVRTMASFTVKLTVLDDTLLHVPVIVTLYAPALAD